MTIYAVRTEAGEVVGIVKAQDDAPPPAMSGDPGYLVSMIDVTDDAIATSGQDAEARIREAFPEFRRTHGTT